MGGRGAASGKKPYGSEYRELLQYGNVKYVEYIDSNASTPPLITKQPNRIYATINKNGDINTISIYGDDGRRTATINLLHNHKGIKGVHVHEGYLHDEHGTRRPTAEEEKLIDKIKKEWYNRHNK